MYAVERDHWWYTGLRNLVLAFMHKYSRENRNAVVLDAGCGTGGMLAECKEYNSFGLDISDDALKHCSLRGLGNLSKGSVCEMPFADNSFDIIISLDVLYHLAVTDDLKALREFYRVVNRNGIMLLNLPAYNFLKSPHDRIIHTRERYTLRDVKEKVERAGFTIERITYRNTFLFPVAAIVRLIKKRLSRDDGEHDSDLKPVSGVVNAVLKNILYLENKLILTGMNFPFGLSVFCVAKKK